MMRDELLMYYERELLFIRVRLAVGLGGAELFAQGDRVSEADVDLAGLAAEAADELEEEELTPFARRLMSALETVVQQLRKAELLSTAKVHVTVPAMW